MKYPVVPAIIPKNREELLNFAKNVSFSTEIQVDVVDGDFVTNSSWPYQPEGEPLTIKHATDKYTLEIDLMVRTPIVAAKTWIDAGADMLVFHIESVALPAFKEFISTCPVSVGVACHGDTPLETLFEYAAVSDYIQLMGIKEIGAQSQPFDNSVIEKIKTVKKNFPDKMISIDGSVNEATIAELKQAGANRFVSGSAIVSAANPEEMFKKLVALVN